MWCTRGRKNAAMTLGPHADLFDADLDDAAYAIDVAVQVASKDVGKMWVRENAVQVRSV
jgi:hypothetical protein